MPVLFLKWASFQNNDTYRCLFQQKLPNFLMQYCKFITLYELSNHLIILFIVISFCDKLGIQECEYKHVTMYELIVPIFLTDV